MPNEFEPSFTDFQKDIEQYIISIGKREKSKNGTVTFWEYPAALRKMFRRYLDNQSFAPLVAHFKSWNWEVGYNDYLLELTTALVSKRDWQMLQELWDGVIAKRRRLYSQALTLEKDTPGSIPSTQIVELKEALLETLGRVKAFADDLGQADDVRKYAEMVTRIRQGKKS